MTRELGWHHHDVRSTIEWPGMRTRYARLRPHPDAATTTGTFQVGVSFSAHSGLVRRAGGRTVRGDVPAGTAFVTGAEPIDWLGVAEPTEALEIYPDRELTDGAPSVRVEPAEGVRDGVLFGLVSLVKRSHVTGAGFTDIEASTVAHRLAAHLAARYLDGPAPPGRRHPAPVLGHRAVDRVAEHVAAHLAEPITLERLAGLAGLSPYHFARAFKAATGLPPHRFVTAARLETAKAALLRGDAPVEEVAYAVGFSNVGHFRRLFRRELGVAPGALRGR